MKKALPATLWWFPRTVTTDLRDPKGVIARIASDASTVNYVAFFRVLLPNWREFPALRVPRSDSVRRQFRRAARLWARATDAERLAYVVHTVAPYLREERRRLARVVPRFAASSLARSENNDCVVVALAVVTGSRYEDAHAACELVADRKPQSGTYTYRLLDVDRPVSILGSTFTPMKFHPATFGTMLKKHPTGWFFVTVRSHALAIVDGVPVDTVSTIRGRRIHRVWRVEPTVPGDGAILVI